MSGARSNAGRFGTVGGGRIAAPPAVKQWTSPRFLLPGGGRFGSASNSGNKRTAVASAALIAASVALAAASTSSTTTTTSSAPRNSDDDNGDDCHRRRFREEDDGEKRNHHRENVASASKSAQQLQERHRRCNFSSGGGDAVHAAGSLKGVRYSPPLPTLLWPSLPPSLPFLKALNLLLRPHSCHCESPSSSSSDEDGPHLFQRRRTLRVLDQTATKQCDLESLYHVDWSAPPLGTGAFGLVFAATNRATGERVALKRIPKKMASSEDFRREMEALLRIQKWGGHPHICALREHFDDEDGKNYYLILDLIEGGEMFEHLVRRGAYSEADAARLVREVASALDFLHGIGVVHNDIKPENLMLSRAAADRVERDDEIGGIQVVDFGCAQVEGEDDDDDDFDFAFHDAGNGKGIKALKGNHIHNNNNGGFTPAYCPPENFEPSRRSLPPLPPADMWALGVIVYIMLTGAHPFDLDGDASDEDIEARIRGSSARLPLGPSHPYTAHLSPSARDLIGRLMERDPQKRLSAYEMLHHPWVIGDTASKKVMEGSGQRLEGFRKIKTQLQKQFFERAVEWSDEAIRPVEGEGAASGGGTMGSGDGDAGGGEMAPKKGAHLTRFAGTGFDESRRKTSLIERSFRSFETRKGRDQEEENQPEPEGVEDAKSAMTMSDYTDLLSENMKHKYFPKGLTVYNEGDRGDYMYFINSGTVEVRTKEGTKKNRHSGDFFGEGALLHPAKRRSASIRCKTPVHAIEINREYFEKYMANSSGLLLELKEKDKIRKRNRAKAMLMLQNGMKSVSFNCGDRLYAEGDEGEFLYIVERGRVELSTGGNMVFAATAGNFCGEHSLLTGRVRNTTAVCVSPEGCVANSLSGLDFRKLMDAAPHMKESMIEMNNKRDFKKALCLRLGSEFPYSNPRKAFNVVDEQKRGVLLPEDVAKLMRELDANYTDEEMKIMMKTLDLCNDGQVTYEEFKKLFISNIRTSQSM